jgi:ribose transport system ATP-binding protein
MSGLTHPAPGPASASPERQAPVLSARGLSKSFGAITALDGVSLDLRAGEMHAICGENGAGKSTLVKILTGVYQPDSGSIIVNGQPVTIADPRQAQQLGIALVAQELSLCPHLSVLDNIWLGSVKVPLLHRRPEFRAQAGDILSLLGAGHIDLDVAVHTLSMGERQLVEIARMLTRDAHVLILDEPTATLSDIEIERIFAALTALKREGRAIIYITHRLGEVFQVCDSVTVLRNGGLVGTFPTGGIDREGLIAAMLGRSFAEMYPDAPAAAGGDVVMRIAGLSVPGAVEGMTLDVPAGKIVCIAGQFGSGASEAVSAIVGLVHDATGTITVNGRRLPPASTAQALKHNVLFISGDRAEEGIFRRLRVADNLVATRLARFSRLGVLNRPALTTEAATLAATVAVDRRRLRATADKLSGGNQQKLAFGRCLAQGPRGVLAMIEPTRGIDVGARAEIYRIMREFCAAGYGLIMTSSDLEEVVGMADIVVTMYRGRQVGHYAREAITMQRVLSDITHPMAAPA